MSYLGRKPPGELRLKTRIAFSRWQKLKSVWLNILTVSLVLSAPLLSLFSVPQPVLASPANWYVSTDNLTIQGAVNAASPGDTIIVRSGNYTENINVGKSLTIQSENGTSFTTVQAADADSNVFTVTVGNVNISGFTITGATGANMAGINLQMYADYCTVQNNVCRNNDIGIYISGSSGHVINSNNCSLNTHSGIYLLYVSTSNNSITGNTCNSNGTYGIHLYTASANSIANNTCNSNNLTGICLDSMANSNLICNNNAYNNVDNGIYLYSSNYNNISGNSLISNGHGVHVGTYQGDSNSNTIGGNTITSNNIGVWFGYSNSNIIIGNNITSNNWGIYPYSANNIVYLNNLGQSQNVFPGAGSSNINTYSSRSPLAYTYHGIKYRGNLGNYYSNYSGTDSDDNGIGDTAYPATDYDNDLYPLKATTDNYTTSIWYLGNTGLYLNDTAKAPNGVTIPAGGSLVLNRGQANPGNYFRAGTLFDFVETFTSALTAGHSITTEVGYTTNSTNFVTGGVSANATGDGSLKIFTLSATGSFSLPAGSFLAVRLTNQSSANYTLQTGGAWSYLSVQDPLILPHVTTIMADNITPTSARVSGNLTSLGTAVSANISFQWGTSSGNYTSETALVSMNTSEVFSANLTGLTPGTTYYFRAKAAGDGIVYGSELSFTTKGLAAIALTPFNPQIALLPGRTQQFTATGAFSDATTANITGNVTWTSSNTSVATIDSSGLATAVAGGWTTIAAISNQYLDPAIELSYIQSAVNNVMVDHGFTTLPSANISGRDSAGEATSNMALFPDTNEDGINLFHYGSTFVNYIVSQNTTHKYWIDTSGTVYQVTAAGAPALVSNNTTLVVISSVEVNSGQKITLTSGERRSNIPVTIKGINDLGPNNGLASFSLNFIWNPAVINVENVTAAVVPGFSIAAGTANNTSGSVTVTGNASPDYLTGNVTVGYFTVRAVGGTGNSTSLTVSVPTFDDKNTNRIPVSPVSAPVQIIDLVAETGIAQGLSSNITGVTVLKVNINRVKNPADNSTAAIPGGIGSYSATVNGTAGAIQFQIVYGVPPFNGPSFNATSGVFAVANVTSPIQPNNATVAEIVPILTGNTTTIVILNVGFQVIGAASVPGLNVPEAYSNTMLLRRGDVDKNGVINVVDSLALKQYLVGQLSPSQICLLNAASPNHDGPYGDKITIVDALSIEQYLVGQRNAYFE